ncbi:efflux transporter outer membrane subunit [Prevotella sp. A2931]|uniref:Efflux transporter outer membrane subunit n=1 Tax=Prevotella illustrans TaxID=2800387 RepID=A0ABS3M7N9_9BACT|nr:MULTISPECIES: efflux transporter outer membrane subunit [Prevotella]MBO1364179.1 efflux transporter outer membrane subunit [Prevotella illustrans]PTL26183.1 multidrug transporter [Prevotella sp. oral taxon 820]
MMKSKINTMLVLGLAALTLSGCKSLYGRYERPDVKTTGLVRDAVSDNDTLAVTDTAGFGNLPWRDVFTDPILQGLIRQALDNNTDLLNAALNVEMAEAQLKAAKLSFLPSFNFSPQGTISSWDGGKATQVYSLPLNASWNVDLFGTLLSSKRAVQAALLQTRDYQVAVKTKVIAGVANMYYTLLMLDKQMQLVNDMEQLTKDTWEIMKLRKDAVVGIRSTAVQSAEANYYSVLTQKTDIRRQIRETENSLSLLIGQQAQTIARGKMDDQLLPTDFSTGVGLRLLNNRADVHAAEMSLAQCFYNVQTARSRFYPGLNISGSGAYTNSGGMGIVNPGKLLWRAVGSLTQPIFQNGRLIAGLKVAKALYEQAYNTWQNAILTAGSEVSNALVKYNSSLEKSKIEEKQIEVLKKNVEDTKDLMVSSRTTYLEVITAQSSLLNTELSKVADDFSRMQAIVNLYSALGGGAR